MQNTFCRAALKTQGRAERWCQLWSSVEGPKGHPGPPTLFPGRAGGEGTGSKAARRYCEKTTVLGGPWWRAAGVRDKEAAEKDPQ